MTRWAKAGSSQKHKRMPEDSTPWEELSKNIKRMKTDTNKKENLGSYKYAKKSISEQNENSFIDDTNTLEQKIKEPNIRKKKKKKNIINGEKINACDKEESEVSKVFSRIKHKKNLNKIKTEDSSLCMEGKQAEKESSLIKDEFSLQFTEKPKFKKRKKSKNNLHEEKSDLPAQQEKDNCIKPVIDSFPYAKDEEYYSNDASVKISKQRKRKIEDLKSEKSLDELNESSTSSDVQKHSGKIKTPISETQRLRKKEIFRQKLKEKRKKLGILLLPQNVENRLYRIKKRLREKGFPPEKIKEIIREERKKAQNEYRKTIVTKTCFNCRQSGHLLADCPNTSNLDNRGTGLCFKCGSAEHISAKCKKKVSGFPFASCFICKNKGHISRECPNNKHGIYPKGGKCNLCDSINHLRKDCPLLKKKSENGEENSIQLHTINEGKSIDEEIIDFQDSKQEQKYKKPKVVAF